MEPLFDKKALGQSRRAGESCIPPYQKLLMTTLIYIEKNIFFKKSTVNKAPDPWMLYLSKIGPRFDL